MLVAVWVFCASPLGAQSASPPQETARPVTVTAKTAETNALPPVSSLFRDLARDVRRLPSVDSAVVLSVAGAASLAMRNHDRRITTHFASSATLDRVFEPGEIAGSGAVHAAAAVATYAAGRLMKSQKGAAVGADLVRAQILTAAMTQGLKLSVRRERPDGGNYSFPSGHSSGSFAFASVLGRHYGWRVGVATHVAAAFVAASRLQENRHFLSDVTFGAAIGLVAGRTATIGRGPARFVVTPITAAGGAGVAFTWIGNP